jgi:GT2 family glycosyltransferase
MANSLCSITVTWNAAGALPRQLHALMAQSSPIDEIIVVDNASTDGTVELLAKEYPKVTVLTLPTNQGVGGIYAVGLEYAVHKKNYSWVWTLDQDSIPSADCLRELLGTSEELHKHLPEKVGILAPAALNLSTGVNYPGWIWRDRIVNLPADDGKRIQMADLVISSGSLISGEAVKDVGLPRKDFFMDFVDFEYCLRMRNKGYLIAVVRSASSYHKLGIPQKRLALGMKRVCGKHPA